jgi:hypothetical protein
MSDVEKLYVPHVGWTSYENSEVVGQGIREGHFEGLEQAFFFLYLGPGRPFSGPRCASGTVFSAGWRLGWVFEV